MSGWLKLTETDDSEIYIKDFDKVTSIRVEKVPTSNAYVTSNSAPLYWPMNLIGPPTPVAITIPTESRTIFTYEGVRFIVKETPQEIFKIIHANKFADKLEEIIK